MKLLKILGLSTAALCAAVFLLVVVSLPRRSERLAIVAPTDPHPVVAGVFHVHTRRSDGTGTVEEVAAAARRAALGFVVFTDHGDGTRPFDRPAYHSGVLCIDGVEVSTTAGHYAAIGMRPSPYPLAGEARDVVEDVTRLGGFGVAAHPDSPKAALRWREWTARFDALEWLNADSEWRGGPRAGLVRALLGYPFRGPEALASLFARPDSTLARWDALTRQRRVVALAAADAHAHLGWRTGGDPYPEEASVKAPSYETVFRTFAIRAQLDRPLTGQPSADALTIRGALAAGHVYTAIDALAGPPAFDFTARSGDFTARGGDDLALGGPVDLDAHVNSPSARVVLLQNGHAVAEGDSAVKYRAPQRAAVFRVEVRLPGAPGNPPVPWIVSNPIYAGGFLDPRTPPVRPDATMFVSLGYEDGGWFVEHEPRSRGDAAIGADKAIAFTYGLAPGDRADQFAALVHRVNGVADADRVMFRASADRPMRVSVQLRTMTEKGTERWQRSVYLDEEPRDVAVFLDDMRPIGPTSTWQADLKKVSSLLFVVDIVNTRPGTAGRVRFEDVRLAR